jgi:peptide/nickel transport system ATP-binding protein
MSSPLLEIDRLTLRYAGAEGPVNAVRDVSFRLEPGRALGIVGESGSGKSSIAGAIMGLLGPNARLGGRILFEGGDLAALPAPARRAVLGRRIGLVFQDPFTTLNPALRVGWQIAEPMVQHLRLPRAEALRRAEAMLQEMGIDRAAAVARCYPHQLSGGMKQRILIAAALACEPPLLILDEPTTALDVTVEAQILDLLARLRARKGTAVLLISHNLSVVRRLCDEVAVLYAGEIVEHGPMQRVLDQPVHPYTKGLLASLPPLRAASRGSRLPSIGGQMPSADQPIAGCGFAARCPFREARCETDPQTMDVVGDDHQARCWKSEAIGAWPAPPLANAVEPDFQRGDALVNAVDLAKAYQTRSGLAAWRLARTPHGVRLRRDPGLVAAVDGVSLTVSPGEVLGLVGESGCGKSTLGRLVLQLQRQTAGSIEFDGAELGRMADPVLRDFRRQAQIVFQNVSSALNPRLSIGTALARPLALFGLVPPAGRRKRVEELLAMVRLPASYRARYPHELSGGERQRVAIARALATGPRFIVCDEPVSALDVSVQAAIVNLLADLRDEFGLAYLFISHDLAVVAQISDRIAVMYRGRLCETGSTAAVLATPFHPYTRALLASVAHRQPIEGEDAGESAEGGCPFRSRCPDRMARCAAEAPALRAIGTAHQAACHRDAVPEELQAGEEPLRFDAK